MKKNRHSKKKVLITGATGYLGGFVLQASQNTDWEPFLLVRSISAQPVSFYSSDARTPTFINAKKGAGLVKQIIKVAPDAIIHLAAYGRYNHKSEDITPMLDANLYLGTCLLEACYLLMEQDGRPRPFVYCGSYWQNAFSKQKPSPNSLYAATKNAFDAIVNHYANNCDVPTLGLKLYDIYGPHDKRKRIVNLILDSLSAEKAQPMSGGMQKLSLLSVHDAVDAIFKGLADLELCKAMEGTYGVPGSETYTLQEIAKIAETITGKSANINWGVYPYREKEIFEPVVLPSLPEWHPKVSLREGLIEMITARNT